MWPMPQACGEEGDFVIAGGEERGAGGAEGGGAGAVEHGVDLLGGGHVGGGDGVVAELGDAELAAVDGDGVDGAAGVGFLRRRRWSGGTWSRRCAVEAADEDFGVGDGAVGAVGVGHAVEGEGDGVEVALGDDAGGVDEVLEVGAAAGRGSVSKWVAARRGLRWT